MPPKNASKSQQPSKKTVEKKKEKIVEDKTFGLKNKKGSKQQKFIQTVQQQVKHGGSPSARKLEEEKRLEREKKEKKAKEALEMNSLFRPVQKVDKAADPKSVLCAFFKQGLCGKGAKCKFSHDLALERKAEKRSIYCDERENEESMGDWDEDKLREVVQKKHGEKEKKKPETNIICKYFLDAVESSKYGWFWECPNGDSCHYRHALPPGFVLKKDKKRLEKDEEISIEELVEKERAALGVNLTKVTLETFRAWKKRKISEKIAASRKDEDKKKADFKAGRSVGLSGREMFTFNPTMAEDDSMEDGDDAVDFGKLREENGDMDAVENHVEFRELDMDALASAATEADGSGTQLGAVCAAGDQAGKVEEAVAIDENLFADDDLDLEELEEHLDDLDLDQ